MDNIDNNLTVFYPHDEMTTFLLPVTIGCQYNICIFCSMYIDCKYSEVPFEEIEMQLMHGELYTERVFLTGADPLSIGFNKMKELLELIHKHLPYCASVASYASIRSISKYSPYELNQLREGGLNILYIGFETGRDDILKLMNKGHTVENAIAQSKKLNSVNIKINAIIMYGIAGEGQSIENAIATANMLNKFQTNKIITMSLIIFERTELDQMVKNGEFTPPSRSERLVEIKTLLENLDPIKETVFDTTHPSNIIKIKGKLPKDKRRLISEVF
nr:radical SAM protein [Tissierella sp.]